MAHGDYNCCAVCDCKMAYNEWDPTTKEQLCSSCAVELAKRGVFVKSGEELLAWMESAEPAKAVALLTECGFSRCWYTNRVDTAMAVLMEKITPDAARRQETTE